MQTPITTESLFPQNLTSLDMSTSKTPTLNRWFDIWMSTYKNGRIKPTTMDTYRALYDRHIRNSVGMHTLDEFHPIHIQKIYNDFLNKGYSPKYLSTLHTMLNNMFKKALANELIASNPCALTDRPGSDISDHRVLTIDEQLTLCEHMKRPRFRHIEPAVTTLLGTGLRIGELLALKWSDIHLADDMPGSYGIPDPVNFLTVRHTFATRSLEVGIPPKVVQHWLGHASIKMTLDLYTHVSHDLSAQYMHMLEASLC